MIKRAIGISWKVLPAQLRRWLTRRVHTTFTISAAGIITDEYERVLLLDHLLRSTVSGWGIPGGFIGRGEQPDDALRREIYEETGLKLEEVTFFRCRTLHRHVEVIMTAKGIGEATVRSREINGLQWFSLEELPDEIGIREKQLIREALSREI